MDANSTEITNILTCMEYTNLLLQKNSHDYDQIYKYMKKASDDDHVESINDLASLILSGFCSNHKDPNEAVQYLKK